MGTEGTGTGATPATDGATPAASGNVNGSTTGATPAGTEPQTQQQQTSATDDALGEGGKKALAEERAAKREALSRAEAAEKRLQELEDANRTESEKAIATARRDASAERDGYWKERIREAKLEGALRGAGLTGKMLDLVIAAPAFRELKVADDGKVEGIDEAIETVKKDYPEAFKSTASPGGSPTTGVQTGAPAGKPKTLEEAIQADIDRQLGRS